MKETASCPGVGLKASPGTGLGQSASQRWPTGGRREEQTAGWEGAGRACRVAWRGFPGARLRRAQEAVRQRGAPTTEGGYHCTRWSKTYSGGGCARASRSGTASTGGSSQAGGPRAGATRGGSPGSPMWWGPPHGGGRGDEGDDAHSVRYRLDCCRSCSQGQRPFRVADRSFADSWDGESSRRSLTGQERPSASDLTGVVIVPKAIAPENHTCGGSGRCFADGRCKWLSSA